MKMPRIMPMLLLGTLACALAACTGNTRPAPALSSPTDAQPAYKAPQKDPLTEAGEVTWKVVTAPAAMLPKKEPPRAAPETYEAPSAVIVRRTYDGTPALQEEAIPPAGAAATQPVR